MSEKKQLKPKPKKTDPVVNGWLTVTHLKKVERVSITIHMDHALMSKPSREIWGALKKWLKPTVKRSFRTND